MVAAAVRYITIAETLLMPTGKEVVKTILGPEAVTEIS
jgi:hypothetical protein